MRILLVSTYELGHQPLGIASAAGALLAAGHDVRAVDLAIDALDDGLVDWAEAAALSVPMHTATRLALSVAAGLRDRRPALPTCAYGLYAPAAAREGAGRIDVAVAGEYEPALLAWAAGLERAAPVRPPVDSPAAGSGAVLPAESGGVPIRIDLGRHPAAAPERHLLGGLDRYARLQIHGEERLAGYVEASHGCVHRCRHCPVPVVYDGRIRTVDVDAVAADVDRLVEMGASHITFGDPDFLNGPHHSLRVLRSVHERHPQLTFDCTTKVEHILRHRDVWTELAGAGFVFVVSAFESTNDQLLERLAKNHTAAEAGRAAALLRHHGIAVRPSFLPFTPWTELSDLVELVDFVIGHDLVPNVDAVQYSIRLLVPPGSLLLSEPGAEEVFGAYDPRALSHPWKSADGRVDALQAELERLVEALADAPAPDAFAAVHGAVRRAARAAGLPGPRPMPGGPFPPVPGLSEAWFCCAEPTGGQLARAGATRIQART